MSTLVLVILMAGLLIAAGDEPQVCADYLFAGRPAPDLQVGYYVERIVCLTPAGMLEPVGHPGDVPVFRR